MVNAKKIRVCIVVPAHWEAVMGGSQYQARMLLEHLIKNEIYDVYYLARRVSGSFVPEGYALKKIASPDGFRRFGEFIDSYDLIKLLKEISPDVIYQRVGCGYTGIVAYYAKKYKKRCVWHVAHDREVMPFDRKISRNFLFRYIEKKFLEYGLRNVDAVITQTQQQADYMLRYYKRRQDAVIPNIHPMPTEKIIKKKPLLVVWVANLKTWKRPEIFIQLAEELREVRDVQFVMIGQPLGDPVWIKEVKSKIERLDNLLYMGGQSQEVVNETLSRAHIFVNTSIHEGFANTFIQAWLRKVPVLSLSVNPDGVFDQEEIGIYAGSYGRLKESLVKLLNDDSLRENMGEKAQVYAKEKHSSANLKRLVEIIMGGN